MAPSETGLDVPGHLERRAYSSREEWLESGLHAVDLLRRTVGRDDLSEVDLLDVRCGTRIVKTLLDHSLPIGSYTGIDSDPEAIEWLRENVSDERFEFHLFDARNPLFNPEGEPVEAFELLPVGAREYDLIYAFSLFTHLPPDDFTAMLRLLRRHVKADGTLLFSLFLIDAEHPSAFEVALRAQLNSDDPRIKAEATARVEDALRRVASSEYDPRFKDADPDRPLAQARYTRDYAIELFGDTGWEIEAIHPPERYTPHYVVCHPA
jgi:SAM-dependent methyltransferase